MMAQSDELTNGAPKPTRRPWSRKLTPAQIKIIAERYYAGSNVQAIMREFNIGRSSLYRYLHDFKNDPNVTNDVTHLRIECERLKGLAIQLALENKQLRQSLAEKAIT